MLSARIDFPGHCWLKSFKKAVKGGEEWTDRENCLKYSCSAEDFSYKIGGCGLLNAPTSCSIIPGDKTKDYPDCCPKISCN
uniref:Single domain-containing protein n=1 Tax=Phlebotomus papatasi TaxID=29031 RepID=A0A1B0GMK8_PHLPP